jgi:hypothetical protein
MPRETGYLMPNPPLSDVWPVGEPYPAEPRPTTPMHPAAEAQQRDGKPYPAEPRPTTPMHPAAEAQQRDGKVPPYTDKDGATYLKGFDRHLTAKDTNPKDAVGIRKWRQFTTIPLTVMAELGVAMLEGARKYGRHNYRVAGVRASVYVDAAFGHIAQWWEGEDIDEDSGLSHITKAIASLTVLRDAMIQSKLLDDRPPKAELAMERVVLQRVVDDMFERHPVPAKAYTDRGEA